MCTISVTLFALTMSMVIKAAEMECRGPTARSDMQLHLIKGYIDDLTVTASSVPGSRWIVQTLEKLIRMDDMSSEPDESRSQEIPSTIENQSTVWENS